MRAIQRYFFNIFLFCFGFGLLFFVKLDSFAYTDVSCNFSFTTYANYTFDLNFTVLSSHDGSFILRDDTQVVLVYYETENNINWHIVAFSPSASEGAKFQPFYYSASGIRTPAVNGTTDYSVTESSGRIGGDSEYSFVPCYNIGSTVHRLPDLPRYSSFENLLNGVSEPVPFDETLELDYFKVSPYGVWDYLVSTPQDSFSFDYKYDIGWSDTRISKVQLKIDSTRSTQTFESSSSPFKGGFKGSTYAQFDGDVVRLIATPFMADGTYGVSLYYSFVQKNNAPLTNLWRKLFKNNHTDNTITIPYENTTVTQPVEGVGTVNNYKVNYNPVTNEFGDLNLYEVYYQPVVIYMPDTPQEQIDDTQEVVSDTYVTNNYYQTTKNINLGFDINFGDISTNDITDTFDSFGNFGNGFGSFINRLASWLQLLFPFLHPAVAASIVFVFGLIVSLAIIALVLKIAGVIADLIPF